MKPKVIICGVSLAASSPGISVPAHRQLGSWQSSWLQATGGSTVTFGLDTLPFVPWMSPNPGITTGHCEVLGTAQLLNCIQGGPG